ncbi:MAG: nitric-oxide reductase large subunit, partial [Chromatiales bacterium]
MSHNKRLWWVLGVMFVLSFTALGLIGGNIYKKAPPVPDAVTTTNGTVVLTKDDIQRGRQVWQSMGGHQVGSIWGHGGYVAPDWSADWLHRESLALMDLWSLEQYGTPYEDLAVGRRGLLQARLKAELRQNTYDAGSGNIVISPERAQAIGQVADHYVALFGNDLEMEPLREQYAIANGAVPDPAHREALTAFFFWT